jgi:alkylation response protein AidB-like acyl-CoA dehydrogenase
VSEEVDFDPVAVARRLAPVLRARSDEIEAARRLPPDLAQQLGAEGLFRVWAPRAAGGLELAPEPVLRAFETLAEADAAVAWCVFIAATSASTLALLPDEAAREILASPGALIGGVFAPEGRAERCPGGFRLHGRWAFASGCENADWVLAGARLLEGGEPLLGPTGAPRQHMLIVPRREVEFLDTWHAAGLCGTGSCDFALHGAFVPERRVVGLLRERPADAPLQRFPPFTLLALGIGAVALGLARAAIDELVALAGAKTPQGARRRLAERASVQTGVAEAEAGLRSARAFLYEALAAAWHEATTGERVALSLRRDLRLATTHAVRASAAAVDAMYALGGGSSVYRRSRLQRCFRDVHVVTQHMMVGPPTLELAGRLLLGLDADTSQL